MAEYRYTAYFEPNPEGGYTVIFPAIPELVTFDRTLEEARTVANDALRCHLEGLMKYGESLPEEQRAWGGPMREEIAVRLWLDIHSPRPLVKLDAVLQSATL
jgi:antitoxin HicB